MRCTMVRPLAAIALAAAINGCATQKKPAETAIAAADSTLQSVAADAQTYVPDRFAAAGAQVTAARADYGAKKYADALKKAQDASTEAGALGEAITAKKAELAAAWTAMSDSLPGMVKEIQTRVAELSKMRRLPAGMDKAKLDAARSDVQTMTDTWTKAMQAHDANNLAEATNLGAAVRDQVAKAKATLGMK